MTQFRYNSVHQLHTIKIRITTLSKIWMQLADSVYNKTRDICNQITECIQQPVSFSSLEEYSYWIDIVMCRETSINPIILTSISQGATQLLTQKLHTILPQKSMDSMIRMLYSQQQQDQKQQYQNTQKEEISIVFL